MPLPFSSPGLLFKLDPDTVSYINQLIASGRSRDLEVTIAVAMVASTLLDVPSRPVEDPASYYKSQAGVSAINFVNAVNGVMIIDFRVALDLCSKFFAQRYENAAMPFQSFSVEATEGVACLFGLTKHIPAYVLECMQKNSKAIVRHFYALDAIKRASIEE